ncbi:MAG: hypothetical protein JNJ49_09640 [Bdellovibrionaceae bacterium]|nr:hypothetical protein [Pseudobdellovibrionaceae bacterium]
MLKALAAMAGTVLIAFSSTSIAGESAAAATLSELANLTNTQIEKMSNSEKSKYLGVNLVRLVGACPVSAWTLTAAAIVETTPFGYAPSLVDDVVHGTNRTFQEKHGLTHFGGAVSFVADLINIANQFLYDSDGRLLQEAKEMKNTKSGYSVVRRLANHFYGPEGKGECGKAGRAISDVLSSL